MGSGELNLVLCGNLEGWDGVGGGRKVQEGGNTHTHTHTHTHTYVYIYIHTQTLRANSHCMAETNNIVKQLFSIYLFYFFAYSQFYSQSPRVLSYQNKFIFVLEKV